MPKSKTITTAGSAYTDPATTNTALVATAATTHGGNGIAAKIATTTHGVTHANNRRPRNPSLIIIPRQLVCVSGVENCAEARRSLSQFKRSQAVPSGSLRRGCAGISWFQLGRWRLSLYHWWVHETCSTRDFRRRLGRIPNELPDEVTKIASVVNTFSANNRNAYPVTVSLLRMVS